MKIARDMTTVPNAPHPYSGKLVFHPFDERENNDLGLFLEFRMTGFVNDEVTVAPLITETATAIAIAATSKEKFEATMDEITKVFDNSQPLLSC